MMTRKAMGLALILSLVLAQGSAWAAPKGNASHQIVKVLSAAEPEVSSEPWKGPSEPYAFTASFMAGYAPVVDSGGFILLPSIARKLVDRGFVPDINNSVYIELAMGPVFKSGDDAFAYSAHLRWDFTKDLDWTFYAVGGFGGLVVNYPGSSSHLFYPRFGLGAMLHFTDQLAARAEVSHEWTTAGVVFSF